MHTALLNLLRCPFCGTALDVAKNDALRTEGDEIVEGVIGCECCAYPVVAGIPVMMADDASRDAIRALEDGRSEDALLGLMGLADAPERAGRFRALAARADATYREYLEVLCEDAEGHYFLYRLSDPTYVTAEGLLRAIAQARWPVQGRVLDLCGGSGHLSRLLAQLQSDARAQAGSPEDATPAATILADVYFWKLWLARIIAPGAQPIQCDANHPLPFPRDAFSMVVLADAFPYIWHKRVCAEEMMRLAGEDGLVVMPHLHSSLGFNYSAGDCLTPATYRDLFEPMRPRLFSDQAMFDGVVDERVVDLTADRSVEEIGDEAAIALVATRRGLGSGDADADGLWRRFAVPAPEATEKLVGNPLYRVEFDGSRSVLTLQFPSAEYEAEFGACRRYLPERVVVEG